MENTPPPNALKLLLLGIVGVSAATLIGYAVAKGWMGPTAAAWAQAVGSLVALFVAFWVPYSQRVQDKRDARMAVAGVIELAILNLNQIAKSLLAQQGQSIDYHIERLLRAEHQLEAASAWPTTTANQRIAIDAAHVGCSTFRRKLQQFSAQPEVNREWDQLSADMTSMANSNREILTWLLSRKL